MKKRSMTKRKLYIMKILLLLSVISFLIISVVNTVSFVQHFYDIADCTKGREICLNETEQLLSPNCVECFDR